ncbi:TetR/AcrR family transcriptional regulator [Streptomyces sp. 8N706]|uniref:TetR/AcrR family transcriptional regulator n=1 Tax=Streptomyces sp. 8N706 TaxID=3457416 RepID=UPI003FCFB645
MPRSILDAALDQLSTVGWSGLTMEGVATAAQTGKTAVHRRWSSTEDLVADALRAGLPRLIGPPDSGSVRGDLIHLCCALRDAMCSRSGSRTALRRSRMRQHHHGALSRGDSRRCGPAGKAAHRRDRAAWNCAGDVPPDATGDLVADVFPAIMMYRAKVCGSELPRTR